MYIGAVLSYICFEGIRASVWNIEYIRASVWNIEGIRASVWNIEYTRAHSLVQLKLHIHWSN